MENIPLIGIIPGIAIDWTLEDFYQQHDPDLEAAQVLLTQ
jgi:hypothetical protein